MKKILAYFVIAFHVFFTGNFSVLTSPYTPSIANATSTSAFFAGTATDLGNNGFAWLLPANATGDTTLTSAVATLNANPSISNTLALTNFNLASAGIPVGATIQGITAEVEWNASNNRVKDTLVQLTKDGITGVGNNLGANVAQTTKAFSSYGGTTNLWGTTWAYADITSPNFGVLLEYTKTRNGTRTVSVYRVRITIEYNQPPTDITLSNNLIGEGLPIGTNIGALSTTDSDVGDSYTYTFACSTPGLDDASFTIAGNNLNSNAVYDYAIKSTYNICVRTTDSAGHTYDKNFVVNIGQIVTASGYAGTAIDLGTNIYPWTNTTNAVGDTTTTSTTNTVALRNGVTNTISLTNFDLASLGISTGSIINGITVDVERLVSNNRMRDSRVQLTKDGLSGLGNNNATNSNGPTAKTISTYGSSTDLWGTTWSVSDITSPDFGVLLEYTNTSNGSKDVDVFRVRISVSYTSDSPDSLPPNISALSFASGSLLPGGNHDVVISYDDPGSGINTSSALMELYKWNGVSWGSDISGTGFLSSTITQTGATYPTNNLSYGKYIYAFQIEDNIGNSSLTGAVFYIDQPSFTVSTGSIDIGTVDSISEVFSTTVTVTVNTVGAGFDILLNRTSSFTYDTESIQSWDSVTGYGYQSAPYTGNISTINTNEIINTQGASVNLDGNLNTYTVDIQLGALIEAQQAAGDYSGTVSIGVSFDY